MQYIETERRTGVERRSYTLAAYVVGGINPRRFKPRRTADRDYPIIDWHAPRVLAAVLGILALCIADGVLTVLLLSQGAIELNPVMALFLPDRLAAFAAAKLILTAGGVSVLVACSQMRLLRVLPGEILLYAVLLAYTLLVAYEWRLLNAVF